MLAPSLTELIAVNPELRETYAGRLLKEMGAGGDGSPLHPHHNAKDYAG